MNALLGLQLQAQLFSNIFVSICVYTNKNIPYLYKMKKLFLLPLSLSLVVCASEAQAQYAHHSSGRRPFIHPGLYGGGHVASVPGVAAKTTATDVRLVSVADIEYDGTAYVPSDSFTLSYSGSMGGRYNDMEMYWDWNFDVAIGYPYASGAYGAADTRVRQHYNATLLVDTSWFDEWDGTASAWGNSMRTIFQYDGSGRLTTVTDQGWDVPTSAWGNYQRQSYTYTPGGNVATKLEEQWGSGASWENSSKTFYTWGSTGLRLKDSSQWWNSSATAWDDDGRITYGYDAADNRIKQVSENWSGSAWDTTEIAYSRNFNTHHQPGITVFTQYYSFSSSWDSTRRDVYVYNSYGKPDLYYDETWFPGTGSWILTGASIGTRYHYETYTPTTGILSPSVAGMDVAVYPVPANNDITISINAGTPQSFSATITDMVGRCYATWSGKAAGEHRETMPVNNMPAGNYLLTIQTRQGSVTKQFSVVR